MTAPSLSDLGIPISGGEGYGRTVEFRVLGSIEVYEEGNGSITLGGPKQRTVLAHLLLRANHLVPAEVLIDEVWGDEPPETARNALQAYASHLRKAVGAERLEGSRAGYLLRADPAEVDTFRFQSMLRDAQRLMPIDPKAAVAVFDQALSLWRGPAFGDLAPEPSLRAEAARLDELRMGAIEDRIEALLTLGVHAEVVSELEGLVARHPMRERLWGQLLLALYRSGRQAEALGAYQRAREILADELGIDPSPELRRLHERILQQSPDLEIGGAPLRGYRLLERVGAGSFGTVWRAVQPDVGRDVAVKAIHPHLANEPDFIRRFETEAQLIARLEHPHIVPLHDFWREPGGAYLVMRYLRGGSLAEALEEAPFEIARAARIIEQVSDALAAAHRQGVVHRDMKPGNILLDDEGNAYLADFGIAKDLSAPQMTQPGAIKGSPLYLAPEQIRGGAITPRTDVYALGIVLYEMLVGEHPFANVPDLQIYDRQLEELLPSVRDTRTDLPPAVHGVIAAATAKDPDLRFPDAATFGTAVHDALAPGHSPVTVPVSVEVRNPYKGLRPFDEADALDFYGREAFVERLLQRWQRVEASSARFTAVVGPSGSGKSSIVRAGLVPALRRGAIEGSEKWFISELVPGRHPMENLEAALLRVAARPPAGLLQVLESGPRGLLRAVEGVVPEGSELILVIDQFEEVFTLTEDEAERSLFLESLRVATAEPSSQTRVVVTLRADFYDRPLNYPRFGPVLGANSEVVTPLAPDELERAIVRPAGSVGLRVEPALVAQVASEVADQPGALPLVQYALTELFEQRDEGVLTLAAYRDIGGVGGALAARGEQLYAARDAVGREAVRQLFLRLVTLGEGAADTRRRVLRSEVSGLDVAPGAMESALDAFGRYRLLTFDRDPATREPTVEVAHEALLRAWPRLRGWIDVGREDVRTLRRLADASTEWERNDREPSFLLRGSRLDQFETWAEGTDVAVGRADLGYIRVSAAVREEEHAAETARRDHERALEHRSVKRLRGLVAVLAVGALVAASLTVVARNQSDRAGRESRIASARERAASARSVLGIDSEASLLLALEAVETTYEADGTALPEAEEALHLAVQAQRLLVTVPGNGVVRWSPDGARILADSTEPGTAHAYDSRTGEVVLTISGHGEDPLSHVNYSPDGRFISTSSRTDASTAIWDAATGVELFRLTVPSGLPVCCWAEFAPDGSLLASDVFDGTARVWDLETREQVNKFDAGGGSLAFSPDGRRLWIDRCVVDPLEPDGGPNALCVEPHGTVLDVSWSQGSRVATTMEDGDVILWNADSGGRLMTLTSESGAVREAELSPDGRRLAVGFASGTVSVWDLTATGGREVFELAGHDAGVGNLKFSPDGGRLASASEDGTVNVWDVTLERGGEWWSVPAANTLGANAVAYSPEGAALAVGSVEGGLRIVDAADGTLIRTLDTDHGPAVAAAFDPGGSRIAIASPDGSLEIRDVRSGAMMLELDERGMFVDVEFSLDGALLVTRSESSTADVASVWNATTGVKSYAFTGVHDSTLAVSPDGQLLAGTVDKGAGERLVIRDLHTGEVIEKLPHPRWAYTVEFSPDGQRLATAGLDGTVRLWDTISWRQVGSMSRNLGRIWDLVYSSDGTELFTAAERGIMEWDIDARRVVALLSSVPAWRGFRIALSPDGTRLAAPTMAGSVSVLALELEDLLRIGRSLASREFTDQECRQFLHMESCPSGSAS